MTEQTEIQPNIQPAMRVEVPAAHRDAIQRSIEMVLEAVKRDKTLRVPRSEEDRANGFADWLAKKREQHDPMMRAAIIEAFAPVTALDDFTVEKYVDCCVWPGAEFWLHHHWALRAQASWWVSYHYGGRITIGMPEPHVAGWLVPLGEADYDGIVGQIVMDKNGVVIESLTATRQEILDKLRDQQLPAVTTTAA